MACSPEYDCQLVLATKDAAVLKAWSGAIEEKPSEPGSEPCARCITYRKRTLTAEKASTARR